MKYCYVLTRDVAHTIFCNTGLVPKASEPGSTVQQTRMIFRLSFPEFESVNYYTPRELCITKYNEFDVAIRLCNRLGRGAYMAKSDLKSGISSYKPNFVTRCSFYKRSTLPLRYANILLICSSSVSAFRHVPIQKRDFPLLVM